MDGHESDLARSNRVLQENVDRELPRILAAYALVGAILLFGTIGFVLDRWLDSQPWLALLGLATGIVVGGINLVSVVRRHAVGG
jgi:F0F1-type ATP synthase assembly protein I